MSKPLEKRLSEVGITRRQALQGTLAAATAAAASGCSSSRGGTSKRVTIRLEGPNQWTNSGSSFGPAWDRLLSRFHNENPSIRVKLVVLPLSQFNQTISTQLSAGTAPELVFNQASYKPYMVYHLDDYLRKPNPFIPGNKRWIDVFDSKYYGFDNAGTVDLDGHLDYIRLSVNTFGLFYNKKAFEHAGVDAPIGTFADLMTAFIKLKAAGYTPFGMDNSALGVGWTIYAIANMMLARYYGKLNLYDPKGSPGKSPELTTKDWARAILTNQISPKDPAVVESLRLLKLVMKYATPNWSGITGTSGAMVNIKDFVSGQAAMTWGTGYAAQTLKDSDLSYGMMPFPTITKETTQLSIDHPAQLFGAGGAGTAYMIPAHVKGEKLDAAIKFLQWMSVGENIQNWLDETGGVPLVTSARPSPAVSTTIIKGPWSEPMLMGDLPGGPPGVSYVDLFDGYLLGSKSLSAEQSYLADMWHKGAIQAVKDGGWTNEHWAKGAT